MPSRRTRVLVSIPVLAAALAGCEDLLGLGGPDPDSPGSLSFQYSGARTGRYDARGPVPETVAGSYAAAYQTFEELTVFAFDESGAPLGDRVLIKSTPIEAGQSVSNCLGGLPIGPGCWVGTITFGVDPTRPDDPGGERYVFTSGSFHVIEKSSRRIAGTFSGIAERSPGGPRIVVIAGFFDAPRRPDAPQVNRIP